MPKTQKDGDAAEMRIVHALARGAMTPDASSSADLRLRDGDRVITVARDVIKSLARRGLIARQGATIGLTREGAARARRLAAPDEPFRNQHAEIELVTIDGPDGWSTVSVNNAESPLAQLMRRKTHNGAAFLTDKEFAAGEKLRADYTRGQIMPRLGANWEAPISTGKRGAPAAELTDGALAARQRVERAIQSVGPELSGVLIDVCCYLKGLEQVEAERRWPARSAKLILKTALGCLARHYDPGSGRRAGPILSWGATGYRPNLSG
jgi:hypothetical protein